MPGKICQTALEGHFRAPAQNYENRLVQFIRLGDETSLPRPRVAPGCSLARQWRLRPRSVAHHERELLAPWGNDIGAVNGAAATNLTDIIGGHNLTVAGPAAYSRDTAPSAFAHTGSTSS